MKSLIFTSVAYPVSNPKLCGLRFLIPDFRNGFVQNEGNRRSSDLGEKVVDAVRDGLRLPKKF